MVDEVDEDLSSNHEMYIQDIQKTSRSPVYRSYASQKDTYKTVDLKRRPFTDIEMTGTDDDLTIGEMGTETLIQPSTSNNQSKFG